MQVRRIRGRKYSDPDLISLIDAVEGGPDPYGFVDSRAETLLTKLADFDARFENAFERIRVLASIAGCEVRPMEPGGPTKQDRDAVLVSTQDGGRRWLILYNSNRPASRIVHSIAHEIVHTFFPNSRDGAQFRSLQRVGGPVPELEQLCDYGAGALTMPTPEVRRLIARVGISLRTVDEVRAHFGTSYEATLYRMVKTASAAVAAGRFCYREPKGHGRRSAQGNLFQPTPVVTTSLAKYRRQSFHFSASSYPSRLLIPWNKSLPPESIASVAAHSDRVESAVELLEIKNGVKAQFQVEAVSARYQPPSADPEWPDVLVLLTLIR